MKVIGITGGVGAGKSRILSILEQEHQAFIIRADDVAKALEEPGQPGFEGLVALLGNSILDEDGRICRRRLADIIFRDQQLRSQVNEIIHPLTWNCIQEQIAAAQAPFAAVESALFNQDNVGFCDAIWLIDTPDEIRITRLMESRGYSRAHAKQIMASQPARETFLLLADYVIDNSGTVDTVRGQIDKILQIEGQQL